MDEWVSIYEDVPQVRKGYVNVSVDVDLQLINGRIIKECFYGYKQNKFYDKYGKHVAKEKILGWRTHEESNR